MASIDLEPITGPQGIVEPQLEGVRTVPNLIDVVVEAHVPDRENWGEQAVLQWFYGNISLVKVTQNDL